MNLIPGVPPLVVRQKRPGYPVTTQVSASKAKSAEWEPEGVG